MKNLVKYLLVLIGATLVGCGTSDSKVDTETVVVENTAEAMNETENAEKVLKFRDVFGEEYETVINPDVPANEYDPNAFSFDGQKVKYLDGNYMLGVDVSHHQGNIDWSKVKAAGYDFAILRIGYRGYGQTGSLNADKMFESYYSDAKAAGLKVGVYFFAQAINEAEAKEEGEFVLNILDDRELDLPVVYDPESILDDDARTDDVTGEQFTKNTQVFCKSIAEAGYQPMIYANMLWEAFELDLSQLLEYPVWYADYEPIPQTPYAFRCWQYSNTGTVEGIEGEVDLDIWMLE